MGAEGAEFAVLPHMIDKGVLCTAVDYITVEFHGRFAPIHFDARDNGRPAIDLRTQKDANKYKTRLRERVKKDGRRVDPPCRTRRIMDMDDESYLDDRSPEQ